MTNLNKGHIIEDMVTTLFLSLGLCLPLVNSCEHYNPLVHKTLMVPTTSTHSDQQTYSSLDFFCFQMQGAVLPTWPLVGLLSAKGCCGRRLLGGDGDGNGPLCRRGSVFDCLGGESSALSPTQVDLVGWN